MSLLLLLRVLGFGVACCSTLAEQEDNVFAVSQREFGPTARPLNGVWWADKWEAKKVLYARAPGATRRQASHERVRTMPLASAGMLLPSPAKPHSLGTVPCIHMGLHFAHDSIACQNATCEHCVVRGGPPLMVARCHTERLASEFVG